MKILRKLIKTLFFTVYISLCITSKLHYHFHFSKPHKKIHQIALDSKEMMNQHKIVLENINKMTSNKTHHMTIPLLIEEKISHMQQLINLIKTGESHYTEINDPKMLKSYHSQIKNLEAHLKKLKYTQLEAYKHLEEGAYYAKHLQSPPTTPNTHLEIVKNWQKYTKFNHDLEKENPSHNETVNNVQHLSPLNSSKPKHLGVGDVANFANVCMTGISEAIPPEFCWKKGGDFGKIPTGCPRGYFRSLAICYKHCEKGYTFVLGVCWQNCKEGTDIGAICLGQGFFGIHFKHTYMSHPLTNFSDKVPCPYNHYKGGALCYRDCKKIGMTNCGIGACARDGAGCFGQIMNMVTETLNAIVSVTSLILTFGGSAGVKASMTAGKMALKRVGKNVINSSFKGVRKYLMKNGTSFIKKQLKSYIKTTVKDLATEVALETICTKMTDSIKNQAVSKVEINASAFIDKIDLIGVGDAVEGCQDTSTENGRIECAAGILGTMSNFDPTGILALTAAFLKPICNIPTKRPYSEILAMSKKTLCDLDEAENEKGSNKCSTNDECQGKRTCSSQGWCQGNSGCSENSADRSTCNINEVRNRRGSNRCYSSSECQGERTCDRTGYCRGFSGCNINEEEDIELPKQRCAFLFSECDFKGKRVEICDTGEKRGNDLVSGTVVSSVVLGSNVNLGLFHTTRKEFTKTYSDNYLTLSKGQRYNCLKVVYGKEWDKTVKSYFFDIDMCVELFEYQRFEGDRELVCENRDLKVLDMNLQSFRKFHIDTDIRLSSSRGFDIGRGTKNIYEFKKRLSEPVLWGYYRSVKLEHFPPEDCILISDEPNFEGRQRFLCDEISNLTENWDNTIDSIKVGINVKKVAFLDHSNKNSVYLILEPGKEVRDIKKEFPKMSDNISTVYLNANKCITVYTEINYRGDSKLLCHSANLDKEFENNVKSIEIDFEKKSTYLKFFREKDEVGQNFMISENIPNVVRAFGFGDLSSFLLIDYSLGVY